MTGPVAARLSGGRLHLQHGPIDLVISADGDSDAVFHAASARFATVLEELVAELPLLRQAVGRELSGAVARRMWHAVLPHGAGCFVTPMASVAGAVADEVLAAIRAASAPRRAWVNNGGDIALWLAPGERCRAAIQGLDGDGLGEVKLSAQDGIGGIATSGQGGRSLSMGIADSVTVLAGNAAAADAAATLIANAVDLPDHPAAMRVPARDLDPDSDLGERRVVTGVGALSSDEIDAALAQGVVAAGRMADAALIRAAFLSLRGRTVTVEDSHAALMPA